MMLSEKEVKAEIRHSLQEWGINLEGIHCGRERNPSHGQFYLNVIDKALEFSNPHISDIPSDLLPKPSSKSDSSTANTSQERKKKVLPRDPCEALEVFLKNELEEILENPYKDYIDCLDINYSYLPPYRGVGVLQDGTFRRYVKRDVFEKFTKNQLDPMKRFAFDDLEVPPAEKYFNNYVFEKAPLAGAVAEVLVVRHVIHNRIPCFCCKRRGSLQWNGGSSASNDSSTSNDASTTTTSWRDMICTACGSSYEIKSKASAEHVLKALSKGMPTGSYRNYNLIRASQEHNNKEKVRQQQREEQQIQNIKQIDKCKHFLVIVSRAGYSYPVKIAEIEKVVPRLSPLSFRYRGSGSKQVRRRMTSVSPGNVHPTMMPQDSSNSQRLSLKSYATVRQSTITSWFRLDDESAKLSTSDIADAVHQVFLSKFSTEQWLYLQDSYFNMNGQHETKEDSISFSPDNASTTLPGKTSHEKLSTSYAEDTNTIDKNHDDDNVEAIRVSLEDLKTTNDDDWETAFDSD